MKSLVVKIVSYGLFLWWLTYFLPELWFKVVSGEGTSYGLALVIVAIGLWIMNDVVKKILKIVTVPLNIFTLWLAWFVVNVLVLYVLQFALTQIPWLSVGIELWSFVHVVAVSLLLSIFGRFISFFL